MSTSIFDSGAKGWQPSYVGGYSTSAINIFPAIPGPSFNDTSKEGGGLVVDQFLATKALQIWAKPGEDAKSFTIKAGGDFFLSGSTTTSPVFTQLGVAGQYSILGYAGVTNAGSTIVSGGDVGAGTGSSSITGFPPGTILLPAVIDNTDVGAAQTALAAAITFYQGLGPGTVLTTADMGTQQGGVYTPGVYSSASSLAIDTPITLNGAGTYVFIADSTITQQIAGSINLSGGAQATNVVWVAGSSFTSIGPGAITTGNILAVASVSLGGGLLLGRALANTGSVTIATAEIFVTAPAGTVSTGATAALYLYNGTSLVPSNNVLVGFAPAILPPVPGNSPFMLTVNGQIDHATGKLTTSNASLFVGGGFQAFVLSNVGILGPTPSKYDLTKLDVPFVLGVQYSVGSAANLATLQQFSLES